MSPPSTDQPAATGPPWFLTRGGETAGVIGGLDSATSPLGRAEAFPASLKHLLAATLPSAVQTVIFWGRDLVAFYNDAYAPTIGDKHPRAMGRPAIENWTELWDDLEPMLRGVIETGETVSARDRPFWIERGQGGETVYFDISYSPVWDETSLVAGVVCSVTETTERVVATGRLRQSERELRLIANALPILIAFVDRDLVFRFANAAYAEWFGRLPAEVVDRPVAEVVGADNAKATRPFIERALAGEEVTFDFRLQSRTGERHTEVRYLPRRDPAGEVDGVHVLVIDVSRRKHAETELRRLNETLEQRVDAALAERRLWAQVFETTDALVAIVDPAYRFLALNKAYAAAFARSYGFPPAIGEDALALLADRPKAQDNMRRMWGRVLAGEDHTLVQEFGSKSDDRPYYELRFTTLRASSGEVAAAVLYGLDVTERLRDIARLAEAEDQLRQSQKMEAIGQLTGGIAHDFNNLLTGIMGSLDLMGTRLAQGRTDGLKRYADAAVASAGRAAALTHRLLAFSRRQPLDPRAVDANELVRSVEDLIRRTLGERIALDIRLAPGLWTTLCDANQLENALLNLVINARDAMPEGGHLTIATANRTLDEAEALGHREAEPGDYVAVSVADDGTGMGEDVVAHAFEPFFTTKPIGQGTGLGLSMIYGFAQQSGGHAAIDSAPGRGTTVAIFLPRHAAPRVEDEPLPEPAGSPEGRGERVLVVEDEPMVRALVVELLAEHGYATLEAPDGPTGLAILQSEEAIDLLVTDVGLPGLNGRQLAEAARVTRPTLRILFITGYAESATQSGGFLEAGMALMTKPFNGDALVEKVRGLIGQGAPAAAPAEAPPPAR